MGTPEKAPSKRPRPGIYRMTCGHWNQCGPNLTPKVEDLRVCRQCDGHLRRVEAIEDGRMTCRVIDCRDTSS